MSTRLFRLQVYETDFSTGVCADGRQAVLGLLCPHLIAYFFDRQGDLIACERRLWRRPVVSLGPDGPFSMSNPVFAAALRTQMREWQTELGFRTAAIRFREFFDESQFVGIARWPEHLDPREWDGRPETEIRYLEGQRAEWDASGQFVWCWGKDYWVAPDGQVEST